MHIVIIGNGIAGISAAVAIRQLDRDARVTILSEEPHAGYSACVLPDYLAGRINRQALFIRSSEGYARYNIRLHSGRKVMCIDLEDKKLVLDAEDISYDKLVIATGSKPVLPSINGMEKQGFFTLKTLNDADRISKWEGHTAVVMGSGPLAVELSVALKLRGYGVMMVARFDRILRRSFDARPAAIIRNILEQNGIEVYTEEKVVEIRGDRTVREVATDSRVIGCDTVFVATGMKPQVSIADGLMETGDNGGIRVDDRMMTNVPDVYACGDCVEARGMIGGEPVLSLLWHNARQQGTVAGTNAAGIPRKYSGSLDVTGLDLFGAHAVSVGMSSFSLMEDPHVIETAVKDRYRCLIFSGQSLVGVQSVNWSENMGALIAAIARGKPMGHLKDPFHQNSERLINSRFFPLGRKIGPR